MTPIDPHDRRPSHPSGNGSIFSAHARASELASKLTRYYKVTSGGIITKMLLTDQEVVYLRSQGDDVEEIR